MAALPDLERFRRTTGDDKVVAGVAGGISRALGVDAVVVRVAFVVLTLGSGLGLVIYVVAWLVMPAADQVEPLSRPDAKALEQAVGVGLVTVGLLLLVRRAGVFLPDQVVWPVALVAAGAAVGWSRLDGRTGDLLDAGRSVVVRVVVGSLLLALGVGIFAALNERIVVATQVVAAVLVTGGGVVLLAGPWIVRLGRQLSEERAERIRADERAAVAAHLHDSVLQTLALIQRRADEPAKTVALARRQERELRSWLHGGGGVHAGSLASALRGLADEIEADHAIAVEVVVVGDAALDERGRALVAAVREGLVNAAKHSGASSVSVYGEVDDDELVAYVRDRGRGFEPDAVAGDRRGLADSVLGRLARHGGVAEVHTAPGEGVELVLSVPRSEVSA